MKKFLCPVLVFIIAWTVSCKRSSAKLYVYNWADYISPIVIEKFESRYNCTVVLNFFDSNEALYAKLKAGAAGYDILFPSSYMSAIMNGQKMLATIDHSKLKNLGNLDRNYLKRCPDPWMKYSVPYMMNTVGIAYNKKRVKDFTASWSMFDRGDLAGRMTLLNDSREVIGAALKFNGFKFNSVNDAELEKAAETVTRWKKNIAKFDTDEAKRGLMSGEFFLIQVYNGDAVQIMNENPDIAYAFPAEGTSISQDDFVIPSGAKNTELAYCFIDFLLEPENSRDNMEFVCYLSPNIAGQKLLKKGFMDNPAINPPADVLDMCDFLSDLGIGNRKYSGIWDKIRSAR